jgi:hypothetical protein
LKRSIAVASLLAMLSIAIQIYKTKSIRRHIPDACVHG